MPNFINTLPDLLKAKRCNVRTLASTGQGWFFHFVLYDDERDSWVEGSRIIPHHTMFESDIDLLYELWCTPGLHDAKHYDLD